MVQEKIFTKKVIIRLVILILLIVVAAGSFAFAMMSNNNKGGWEQISFSADSIYNDNLVFNYYMDNDDDLSIIEKRRAITSIYVDTVYSCYRLFDEYELEDALFNIAYINNNPNQDIVVSSLLYETLKDAYDKSSNDSYSVFGGGINYFWNDLFITHQLNDNSLEFDPVNNMLEKVKLQVLTDNANDRSKCDIIFKPDNTIYFQLDTSLEAYDYPIIDLGVLKDAYILELLKDRLLEQGLDKGYISNTTGITMILGGNISETNNYLVGYLDNYKDNYVRGLNYYVNDYSVIVNMTSFAISNNTYSYSINDETRCIYNNHKTGYYNGKFDSLSVSSSSEAVSDIVLYSLSTFSVSEYTFDTDKYNIIYSLKDDGLKIYSPTMKKDEINSVYIYENEKFEFIGK